MIDRSRHSNTPNSEGAPDDVLMLSAAGFGRRYRTPSAPVTLKLYCWVIRRTAGSDDGRENRGEYPVWCVAQSVIPEIDR